MSRASVFIQFIKLRLTLLVVFSAAIVYVYAQVGDISWLNLVILILSGLLVTGSANGFNQVIEHRLDKLMPRTANRPIPSGSMTVKEGWILSSILGLTGILLMWFFLNGFTAALAAFSLFSYAFVYTPLKQETPWAVFIGAFPGAMPALLGWAAATGSLASGAWMFFIIQFVWQFPHFWAIAWVLDDDYRKAGFSLLPSKKGKDSISAYTIFGSTLVLIFVSMIPYQFGESGMLMMVISLGAGLVFFYQAIPFLEERNSRSATQLMFASFVYLPIVQIILLIDKLI